MLAIEGRIRENWTKLQTDKGHNFNLVWEAIEMSIEFWAKN